MNRFIEVISQIKPKNNGSFPIADTIDLIGGYIQVDTVEDMHNHNISKLREGMLCYVQQDKSLYIFQNNNWSKYEEFVNKDQIVNSTGNNSDVVMSQKAVTDELNNIRNTYSTIELLSKDEFNKIQNKNTKTLYMITNNGSVEEVYVGNLPINLCKCSSDDSDVEKNLMYYGYIIDDTLLDYNDITKEHLNMSTMLNQEVKVLGKTSIGNCPGGSRILVAVPKNSGLKAYKDNGLGGLTQFDESILGVNGIILNIDTVDYLIFGEFASVAGERFIYIN